MGAGSSAIAGAAAPVLYGNVYAVARKRGLPPGTAFFAAALLGAFLPQVLLSGLRDEDLVDADAKKKDE